MAKNRKKLNELRRKEIKLLNSLMDIWVQEQIAFKGFYEPAINKTIEEWRDQVNCRIGVLNDYLNMEDSNERT